MKIHCTAEEFGQIVRACVRCSCYQCALEQICESVSGDDMPKVERLVGAITDVEPEAKTDV